MNFARYILGFPLKPQGRCDGEEFEKLKFEVSNEKSAQIGSFPEYSQLKDKILLEVTLSLG